MIRTKALRKIFITTLSMFILLTVFSLPSFQDKNVLRTNFEVENIVGVTTDNIYLTGELLDVDGICGGYNLHFAWATGYIAGKGI